MKYFRTPVLGDVFAAADVLTVPARLRLMELLAVPGRAPAVLPRQLTAEPLPTDRDALAAIRSIIEDGLGYRRAIDDGVIAPFTVALVGVEFTPAERDGYDELTAVLAATRAKLIAAGFAPAEPVGDFFAVVARLARGGDQSDAAATARQYLYALQERRRLLAETPAKDEALNDLVPALRACERAIVFTQSIAGAEGAAERIRRCGLQVAAVHSRLTTSERRAILTGFGIGDLQVVAAPQVLDEGIDVPAADLAIVLAASRSRRQMIQRMGRVLRRKPDRRAARFVIVFVVHTIEDPAWGAHEGFLDEVIPNADAVRVFSPGERLEVG